MFLPVLILYALIVLLILYSLSQYRAINKRLAALDRCVGILDFLIAMNADDKAVKESNSEADQEPNI